jgi:riboflavin synthase
VFTGIIEETGAIRELRILPAGAFITLSAQKVPTGLAIGDSVSVNGVCLTATRVNPDSFSCDISAETLRVSSFQQARPGMRVNLERSLRVGDRLGGHFVLGHVDGLGKMLAQKASGEGFEIYFEFPQSMERYLVYKGSIAVDGISLTIASLSKTSFSVAVIPYTFEFTNLRHLKAGDAVNLEADVLGKYIERFFQLGLTPGEKPAVKLTEEYLKSQGF